MARVALDSLNVTSVELQLVCDTGMSKAVKDHLISVAAFYNRSHRFFPHFLFMFSSRNASKFFLGIRVTILEILKAGKLFFGHCVSSVRLFYGYRAGPD